MAGPQYPYPYPHPAQPAPSTQERPVAAGVLAIVGGVFVVLGGLFALAIFGALSNLGFGGGGILALFGLFGVIDGILLILMGALIASLPQHHVAFGALIIVFAVLSLSAFFGGFVVGFILALIGGILGLTWHPTPAVMYVPYVAQMPPPPISAAPPQRVCLRCGRVVANDGKFCAHCGNPLG